MRRGDERWRGAVCVCVWGGAGVCGHAFQVSALFRDFLTAGGLFPLAASGLLGSVCAREGRRLALFPSLSGPGLCRVCRPALPHPPPLPSPVPSRQPPAGGRLAFCILLPVPVAVACVLKPLGPALRLRPPLFFPSSWPADCFLHRKLYRGQREGRK